MKTSIWKEWNKIPGKIKDVKERSMPERGRCFSMGYATLSGSVAVGCSHEKFIGGDGKVGGMRLVKGG